MRRVLLALLLVGCGQQSGIPSLPPLQGTAPTQHPYQMFEANPKVDLLFMIKQLALDGCDE